MARANHPGREDVADMGSAGRIAATPARAVIDDSGYERPARHPSPPLASTVRPGDTTHEAYMDDHWRR
jgi:hypothetical protein